MTNLLQAHADPDDPYDSLSGASAPDTREANSVVIPIPDGITHAYIWAMGRSESAGFTLSTAPVIRCFGRTPFSQGVRGVSGSTALRNFSLARFNSNIPDLQAYPSANADSGLYIPVLESGYTRGSPTITLDQIALRHQHADSFDVIVTEPRLVVVAGLDRLLATVDTAGVLSGGSTTALMALCRFVI